MKADKAKKVEKVKKPRKVSFRVIEYVRNSDKKKLKLEPRPVLFRYGMKAKSPTVKTGKPFVYKLAGWTCGQQENGKWYIAHVIDANKMGLILRWDNKEKSFNWESLIPIEKAIPVRTGPSI